MYVGFGKKKQILKIVAHVRQQVFFYNFTTKFPVQLHNYIRNTGLEGLFDIQLFFEHISSKNRT
jgi:hypothetical protein